MNDSNMDNFPDYFSLFFNNNDSTLLSNISLVNRTINNETHNVTNLLVINNPILQIEPNWFYSASAQSAAAIVGLMGAFIITKLINEKAASRQIMREISDYNKKLDKIEGEIKTKSGWLEKINLKEDTKLVEKFLQCRIPKINPDKLPSLDELYEKALTNKNLQDINKNILQKKYNKQYLDKIIEYQNYLIIQFLKERLIEIRNDTLPSIDDLYKNAITRERYRYLSKNIFIKRYPELSKAIRSRKESSGTWATIPYFEGEEIKCQLDIEDENNITKSRKYQEVRDELNTKKAEQLYYKSLIEEKIIYLETNPDILDLRGNIATLVLYSLLGIFLPLYMMLLDYETMLKYRMVTFCLILFGWLLVSFNLTFELIKLLKVAQNERAN